MTTPNQPQTTPMPESPLTPDEQPTEPATMLHPPAMGEPMVPPMEPFETFEAEWQTILGVDPDRPPASLLWTEAIQESLDEVPDEQALPFTDSSRHQERKPHRQD